MSLSYLQEIQLRGIEVDLATPHPTLPQRPAAPDRTAADDGPYAGRGGTP
jgi:hypothetical protein